MTDDAIELKIAPKWYKAIESQGKRFEVRINDRDYRPGMRIVFREWCGDYTGRRLRARISYVLTSEDFPDGIKEGYCVFCFRIV